MDLRVSSQGSLHSQKQQETGQTSCSLPYLGFGLRGSWSHRLLRQTNHQPVCDDPGAAFGIVSHVTRLPLE